MNHISGVLQKTRTISGQDKKKIPGFVRHAPTPGRDGMNNSQVHVYGDCSSSMVCLDQLG